MEEFEAYIEMIALSDMKYVFDENQGKLVFHRKLPWILPAPFNYGFIKNTRSGDGDPLDVFVISNSKITLGSTLKVKPIGVLYVVDEVGIDNKIVAVNPEDESVRGIQDISELGEKKLNELKNILEGNKRNIPGKWTRVEGTAGKGKAMEEIKKTFNH